MRLHSGHLPSRKPPRGARTAPTGHGPGPGAKMHHEVERPSREATHGGTHNRIPLRVDRAEGAS